MGRKGELVPGIGGLVVARTGEEVAAILRLRYQIYVREQRKAYPEDDSRPGRLEDGDDARAVPVYAADEEGQPVGACRMHVRALPRSIEENLRFETLLATSEAPLASLSRLVVGREHRGSGMAHNLIAAIYCLVRMAGARVSLARCRPALAPVYLRMGNVPIGEPFVESSAGRQLGMAMLRGAWGCFR